MKQFISEVGGCRRAIIILWAWIFFVFTIHFYASPPNGKTIRLFDIGIALIVGLYCYKGRIDYLSFRGWQLGLVLGVGLIMLDFWQFRMGWQPFDRFSVRHWFMLIVSYIILAYNEELWFRGLWFAQWQHKPIIQIFIGALLFGLAHIIDFIIYSIHHSPPLLDRFVLTSIGGIFFGIARYRGASLLMIAIPHALVDLIDMVIAPSTGNRFTHSAVMFAANLPVYLVLLGLLFWCPITSRKLDNG